jgi:putative transposase
MCDYFSKNRHKGYLKCHLIFVCKYRKKILHGTLDVSVKRFIYDIASKSDFTVEMLETDKDHVHLLIQYPPTISVSSIVRRLKQESTWNMWLSHPGILRKTYWKEHTLWTDGYFACSTGDVSSDIIREYIANQG